MVPQKILWTLFALRDFNYKFSNKGIFTSSASVFENPNSFINFVDM